MINSLLLVSSDVLTPLVCYIYEICSCNLEITQTDRAISRLAALSWDWHAVSGFWECTTQSWDCRTYAKLYIAAYCMKSYKMKVILKGWQEYQYVDNVRLSLSSVQWNHQSTAYSCVFSWSLTTFNQDVMTWMSTMYGHAMWPAVACSRLHTKLCGCTGTNTAYPSLRKYLTSHTHLQRGRTCSQGL